MRKVLLGVACALAAATAAPAHFVFVVPSADGSTAQVVFSEDLSPDEAVSIAKAAGLKLTVRDASGKEALAELKASEHSLSGALPGSGPRVAYGSIPYGVMQKGEGKPYLLTYHPKAVIGEISDKQALGAKVPAELIPIVENGKVRFQLLGSGKPVAGADVTVIEPDGSKVKVKTGSDGRTEAVEGSGRFGAWARFTESKAGELSGKKYEEIRHYATLVADLGKK